MQVNLSVFYCSVIFWLITASNQLGAQEKNYIAAGIGFYNVENLFDTIDSPDTWDTEFTPRGDNLWNGRKYREKMQNMARVLSELGTDLNPDGLAIIGLSEIENRSVLDDLIVEPSISDRNYKIVQYESPDWRGIDVALLYNPKYFKSTASKAFPVTIPEKDGDSTITRDVLYVEGLLAGDKIHIMVNHWPSRSGGEKASEHKRKFAAQVCRDIVDSLRNINSAAKIIVMGDLNDDPVSPSVRKVLGSTDKKEKTKPDEFYNPMGAYFKKGIGSNAWRDTWNLFDQILISQGLINRSDTEFYYYKSAVYNPSYLIQKSGRYKGYPFRTYSGDNYMGGYSDHFPVFIYLVKQVN